MLTASHLGHIASFPSAHLPLAPQTTLTSLHLRDEVARASPASRRPWRGRGGGVEGVAGSGPRPPLVGVGGQGCREDPAAALLRPHPSRSALSRLFEDRIILLSLVSFHFLLPPFSLLSRPHPCACLASGCMAALPWCGGAGPAPREGGGGGGGS